MWFQSVYIFETLPARNIDFQPKRSFRPSQRSGEWKIVGNSVYTSVNQWKRSKRGMAIQQKECKRQWLSQIVLFHVTTWIGESPTLSNFVVVVNIYSLTIARFTITKQNEANHRSNPSKTSIDRMFCRKVSKHRSKIYWYFQLVDICRFIDRCYTSYNDAIV